MPYDPQSGWITRPASGWRARITARIESEGTEVDPEGALAGMVQGVAAMAERSDLEVQLGISQQDVRQQVGSPLASTASSAGVIPRPATASTATLTVTSTGAATTYPAGYLLSADSVVDGTTQVLQWEVLSDTAIPATPSTALMQVQCTQTGTVTLDTLVDTTFSSVTPIGGIDSAVYETANTFTTGKPREQDPSIRRRSSRERATTMTGRVVTALENIPWVTRSSVTSTGPATVQCTIVPAPPTSADKTVVAQAIADALPPGVAAVGTSGDNVTPAGGTDADLYEFSTGSIQTVAVAVVATPAASYTLSSVTTPIVSAVEGAFAGLGTGEGIRYVDVVAAIAAVDGLTTFDVTLDGGTANIAPSVSTDLLVASTTVT